MSKDENTSRIEGVEARVEKVEDKVEKLDSRVTPLEYQVGRLTSHIESEVGTTNRIVKDLDQKLFGEGDDEYGGRIGRLSKAQHKFELRMAYGAGFVGALLLILESYSKVVEFLHNLLHK